MPLLKEEIELFIKTVQEKSGYDFSEYSERSFSRRLDRILIDYKLDFDDLIQRVTEDLPFIEQVVKDITVNTTELFRDPAIWQTLRFRVLPRFYEQNTINIWHAGCSTGLEVYSMLILLSEMGLLERANVFATDINTKVLDVAKQGEYKYRYNIEYIENYNKVIKENPYNYDDYKDVPFEKYFEVDKARDILKIKPQYTKIPLFRKHNLVSDGNIFYTKFDMIMCRNVLIYFNSSLQNKVFDFFHSNLFRDGILALGAHESILGPMTMKFHKKGQIYTKK